MRKNLPKNPPELMSERAKDEYRRIIPYLNKMETSALDVGVVIAYCRCYANFMIAQDELDLNGLTIETPRGFMQTNPHHTIMRQNADLIKKLSHQIGISLITRKSAGIESMSNEESEDFE
jgi:P27 family predicted phage terminase small subunit